MLQKITKKNTENFTRQNFTGLSNIYTPSEKRGRE